MKNERIEQNKLSRLTGIFWFLLYILPILSFAFYSINSDFSNINFSTWLGNSLASSMQIFNFNFMFQPLQSLIITINNNSFNTGLAVACCFVSWYVLIWLLHFFVDILLFLPNIIKKLVFKLGGDC